MKFFFLNCKLNAGFHSKSYVVLIMGKILKKMIIPREIRVLIWNSPRGISCGNLWGASDLQKTLKPPLELPEFHVKF